MHNRSTSLCYYQDCEQSRTSACCTAMATKARTQEFAQCNSRNFLVLQYYYRTIFMWIVKHNLRGRSADFACHNYCQLVCICCCKYAYLSIL